MSFRLWYPQLDVYDAVRRMGAILFYWESEPPSHERLYISDFYFANPPLLFETHMPSEIRSEFNKLGIPRTKTLFLSYPSASMLFHRMDPVQKEALQTLIGKGLLDNSLLELGKLALSTEGRSTLKKEINDLICEQEFPVLMFLVKHFSQQGRQNINELRRSSGLRRSAA